MFKINILKHDTHMFKVKIYLIQLLEYFKRQEREIEDYNY